MYNIVIHLVNFLIHYFCNMHKIQKQEERKGFLIKTASFLSVLVAILIMIVKIYGWTITSAQSLLASFVDSLLDVVSSLINLLAVTISFIPPDDEYRFGRNKYEDLAIFSQSVMLFFSCIFAIFTACKSLYLKETIDNLHEGIKVMLFSTLLTIFLLIYQTYVVWKTKSPVVFLDRIHYSSDVLANLFVMGSLYFTQYFWFLDPLVGIGISLYVVYFTFDLSKNSIHNLIDKEFSKKEKQKIVNAVSKNKFVTGMHELKTRSAGSKLFIQFHIEMDGNLSLYRAHEISDDITQELKLIFPSAEILIHQDPKGIEKDVKYKEII